MNKDQINITKLANYKLLTSFCREQHIHGGVAIFAKQNEPETVDPISVTGFTKELYFECAAVHFNINNKEIALVVVYRSCCLNSVLDFSYFIKCLNELLCFLSRKYEFVVICGDLNVDYGKVQVLNLNYKTYLTALLLNQFFLMSLLESSKVACLQLWIMW